MRVSKSKLFRCGATIAAVLTVGWGIWRCQDYRRFAPIPHVQPLNDVFRIWALGPVDLGWPMPHTREPQTLKASSPSSAQVQQTFLTPGLFIDVAVWGVMLAGTTWIVWRWSANPRQFRLRTMFALSAVAAVLLSWWKCEHRSPATSLGELDTFIENLPMLALLQFPWYVYVPVLFGLACGICLVGWASGRIMLGLVQVVRHVGMPKLP